MMFGVDDIEVNSSTLSITQTRGSFLQLMCQRISAAQVMLAAGDNSPRIRAVLRCSN
uniref:Uncharacterized protein n=1 Tax=mine drainage metagenome TaxID=410659 RepID=E6QIX8_9ZZZZ